METGNSPAMPERINGGLALSAIGAVVLVVSLFLDWYAPGRSAWTVFEFQDLVLAWVGVFVLGIAVADVAASPESRRYVPEGSVLWAGIGALIIVVATLIQPPPPALHDSPEAGAWIALVGAVLITAGGILLRARISVVITLRPREPASRTDIRVSGRPEGTMPEPPGGGSSTEETETRPIPGERER